MIYTQYFIGFTNNEIKRKERIPDLFFNHFETLGLMEEETGGPEVAIYARGHTASH